MQFHEKQRQRCGSLIWGTTAREAKVKPFAAQYIRTRAYIRSVRLYVDMDGVHILSEWHIDIYTG